MKAISRAQQRDDERNHDSARPLVLGLEDSIEQTLAGHLRRSDRESRFENIARAVESCLPAKLGSSSTRLSSEDLPEQPVPDEEEIPDRVEHADLLRQAFAASHASCSCHPGPTPGEGRPGGERKHHTMLNLLRPTYWTPAENGPPTFEMLISPAVTLPDDDFAWSDTHILVPNQDSTTEDPGRDDLPSVSLDRNKVCRNLCEITDKKYLGSTQHFQVVQGSLRVHDNIHDVPHAYDPVSRKPARNALHLGQLIDKYHDTKPHYFVRILLAYSLAVTVWRYYETSSVHINMRNDRVQFMGKPAQNCGLCYFCKPYLTVDFCSNLEGPSDLEHSSNPNWWCRYPKILALGTMMTEIAIWDKPKLAPDFTRITVDEFFRLKGIIANYPAFREDCKLNVFGEVIQYCFDLRSITSHINASQRSRNTSADPGQTSRAERELLYEKVVKPLKKLVEAARYKLGELEHEPLTTIVDPRRHARRPCSNPDAAVSRFSPLEMTYPDMQAKEQADSWIRMAETINWSIKQDANKRAVIKPPCLKIAILDTGYDEDVLTFNTLVQGTSKPIVWKDFVPSNSPKPVDLDGHGTHLLTLILRLGCPAEIYVARITENSQWDVGDTVAVGERIANAIDVAATEWKVDFVSMSFGFTKKLPSIEQAIRRATRSHSITFMAAANNMGLNQAESFPASSDRGAVISVRATDAAGGFLSRYNPPSLRKPPVFGTLGFNVLSDWPRSNGSGRRMSGCSVATPIAVVTAVMIIDWATKHPRLSETERKYMREGEGVLKLLIGMLFISEDMMLLG